MLHKVAVWTKNMVQIGLKIRRFGNPEHIGIGCVTSKSKPFNCGRQNQQMDEGRIKDYFLC